MTPKLKAANRESSVINLRETMDRLAHDEELLADLVEVYFQDAPRILRQVGGAIQKGDMATTHEAVHGLKGMAANFGAAEVVETCQVMEDAAAQDDATTVETMFPALEASLHRLNVALRELSLADAK